MAHFPALRRPRRFRITEARHELSPPVGSQVTLEKGQGLDLTMSIRQPCGTERQFSGQFVSRGLISGVWDEGVLFRLTTSEGGAILGCRFDIDASRPESDSWTADEDGP